MKNLTFLSAALFAFIFLFNTEKAISDPGTGAKSAELNTQIIQEIKEILKNPCIKYETRDLSGDVIITTTVNKNGKIFFSDIKGLNENLNENVIARLNSLNLWTSTDYSGIVFFYNLTYNN